MSGITKVFYWLYYYILLVKNFSVRVIGLGGTFENRTTLVNQLKIANKDLVTSASLMLTPNGFNVSKLYALIPSNGDGDLDVVRAGVATRYTNIIQEVPANVPRTNSSYILFEYQATNLLINSENFLAWLKSGITVTSLSIAGPGGTLPYPRIQNSSVVSYFSQNITSVTATIHTFSFYIRNQTSTKTRILITSGVTVIDANINWSGLNISSITNAVGSIDVISIINGWYRISGTYTSASTTQNLAIYPSTLTSAKVIYFWGAQLEVGNFATSYIPTTTAPVTRNTDVISKTGISSLINSTEGVLFINLLPNLYVPRNRSITLSDGTTDNFIKISYASNIINTIYCSIKSATTFINIPIPITNISTPTKIAIRWKVGDTAVFIGISGVVEKTSITLLETPTGLSKLSFNDGIGGENFEGTVVGLNIYPTALTDTQLITLTT